MQGNLYWIDYPSPEGTVVGARVGVARGVSSVGNGGGSVGMGGGSSVGFGVWVGLSVGCLVGGAEVVVGVGGGSRSKWGTYSRCPM